MYWNLRQAIRKKKLTLKEFAALMGIAERTVVSKINGSSDWTYGEYRQICSIFPEENPEHLMEKA